MIGLAEPSSSAIHVGSLGLSHASGPRRCTDRNHAESAETEAAFVSTDDFQSAIENLCQSKPAKILHNL